MKIFRCILDFFNIHPDKNQRWTLSTLFIVGLLDAYVGPAISKAWVTELPAEWLAFQPLVYSVVGLFIGMIWKGMVRRWAIRWFTVLCIIESAAGFFVGMWLCFVEYNVWVLAIACLLYGTEPGLPHQLADNIDTPCDRESLLFRRNWQHIRFPGWHWKNRPNRGTGTV